MAKNKFLPHSVMYMDYFILHPNGVSFKADGIAKETPTDTEFTASDNWDLRFDAKNVRLAKIVIPAAQLAHGE